MTLRRPLTAEEEAIAGLVSEDHQNKYRSFGVTKRDSGKGRIGIDLAFDEQTGKYACVVENVLPDSAAAIAGLTKGMRILRVNGKPVATTQNIRDYVLSAPRSFIVDVEMP